MRQVYSIFIVYLMLFPVLADATQPLQKASFADAQTTSGTQDPRTLTETPQETAAREAGLINPQTAAANGVPRVNEFMCASSELKPNETQNILDLLKDGYTGKEIAGQTEKNENRDSLANKEIILVDPEDENSAVKTEIPNQKFKPQEISQFLNMYINGPFAFGVVLTDSLRTGRCENFGSPECSLTGPNLTRRNSGVGIVADTKPVREAFGDIYDSWFDGNENLSQFSKEQNDALRAAIETDGGQTQIKTAERLETTLIPNSILTEYFDARMQTNCNNSSCVISTYSMFDKYFNSWMSSEMVVSTFGPSLLYQTKRLFGWTGRRGFLSGVREEYQKFLDRFRKEFINEDSFLQKVRAASVKNKLNKYPSWKKFHQEMVTGHSDGSGYELMKTETFQTFWGKQLDKGGFIDSMKSAEERADFLKYLVDMRAIVRAGQARVDEAQLVYKTALAELGPQNPVTKQKLIDYGREFAHYLDQSLDESGLGADAIEWIARYPNVGMYNKGVKQILPDGTSDVVDLFTDHRNFQRILKKFYQDGTFEDFEGKLAEYGSAYQTRGGNIVLYAFDKDTAQPYRGLSYSNLGAVAKSGGTRRDTFVGTDYGEFMRLDQASVSTIQSRLGANPQLFEGNWKETFELTPADLAQRITNARTRQAAYMPSTNIDTMIDTIRERNWNSRRYWNALDKLLAQEDELVRSYFTIQGGAKWTALPFGYWWAKKGFGVESISQYQLPDTWHDLKFTHGSENVYDYSYIDFFANEGSDQGDLFVQVLNKLPWKVVLDAVSEKFNPLRNLYDSLTKNQLRNETEDLAFYLTGPEECANCSVVIRSDDLTNFRPFFFVNDQKLVSYILEDTKTETAKKQGQTLITFVGHMNLEGQSGQAKGEPINLVDAINHKEDASGVQQKTCKEAVDQLQFYGVEFGKYLPEAVKEKGRIGGVLSGLESITYGTFFWAGIFSTAAIQLSIAPQLHECVDVDEGYYAHYFVPTKEVQDKQTNTTVLSSEKVSNLVDELKKNVIDTFESDANTTTKKAVKELGDEFEKFSKDAKDNDIVQATMKMNGLNSGQLDSKTLFYFWCGKGCDMTPASYRQEGSQEVRGTNGTNVGIDFKKGEITRDGVPIVQSPDNVRMASTNLGIPAIEIPHTLTETCIQNTTDVALEISANGDVRVLNQQFLDCIKQGVLEQTGLPLQTDKLNDAFGSLEVIVTSTHPNVKPMGDRIVAEGVPRKIAEGANQKVFVLANKDVNLSSSNDGSTDLGTLVSLQFANGTIVVKPNGCFLTWLRHSQDGILSKDLVKGLKTDLDRETNPQTLCEEPVVDFELIPDLASDLQIGKVDNFNKSLKHMGPFSVFETPTQRFVISSEPDDSGNCVDHLRVIDKETGKVTDYTGSITQTPDGFKITTPDGQEHEVKFSTKDGAPMVQLDGNKPEVLTAAQGKNGSFYYNPDTGTWFAENAQLLPLIEAFREGIAAKVQPNGETTATASGNVLNLNVGGNEDKGFLNLPSLPEDKVLLLLFIALIVMSFVYVQRRKK